MLYLRQPAWLWVKKHDPGPIPPIDMTTELQVLKDADALDRTRLGDLDTRYLRTEAAVSLVD